MGEHESMAVELNDGKGKHMAGAQMRQRSVGADSFRRLTALLKKSDAAQHDVSVVTPSELNLRPIFPAPSLPVEPASVLEVAPPTPVPSAVIPESESQIMAVLPVAIAPLQELPADIEETPAVPEVPEIVRSAEITPEVSAAQQITISVIEPMPVIVPVTAEVEPEPQIIPTVSVELPVQEEPLHAASNNEKLRRSVLRRKAQDDFAQVPDTKKPKRADRPKDLTEAQETEKAELARSLLDMMAAGDGQPQERALAADTLLRMLPQLPARTRTVLAERLSIMAAPPPFLVSRLIAEPDLAIAGPLLEDCSHISDEDLFTLIQAGDAAKCRLLARRRKISRPVAEALARSQDVSVLLTLVRNQGAEIPSEGYTALAAKVEDNPDLLAPLCTRGDLPVHFAFELFWLAPAQLRRYLLSRFLTDSEMLTKILKITMGTEAETNEPSQDLDLAAVGHAIEQVMGEERDEGVRTLASAAKVNVATVERILKDKQGEPLMALLKAVGVPRSEIEKALPQMAQGPSALIDPERKLDEVQSVFNQLSFNKARILLTYWDWACMHNGPYAPAH
jgi:uncharacterized protein (DUF2336 family)